MKVYRYGAKVLREKAEPVKWSPEIRNFIMEMFRTMKAESGVGLAAPQVGKSSRIIIIDVGEGPMAFINPEIIKKEGESVAEEGCLSFPGIYFEIERAEKIEVKAVNDKGGEITVSAAGLAARAIQHEVDHLNGVLIVDRASFLNRKLAAGKLRKIKKEGQKDEMFS